VIDILQLFVFSFMTRSSEQLFFFQSCTNSSRYRARPSIP